jgi:hypothetical protein
MRNKTFLLSWWQTTSMKNTLLTFLILSCMHLHAQETVTIKKGDIKNKGVLIATYDGKGGAFRLGNYGVFLPNSKDTSISLREYTHDFENPLFEEELFLYRVTFNGTPAQSIYIRPKPTTGKLLGKYYETYGRKLGKDVIEELFNDTVPVLLTDKGLDNDSVTAYIKRCAFDLDKLAGYVKSVEDTIAMFTKDPINRDKAAVPQFRQVNAGGMNDAMSASYTYEIYQGDVLLGRMIKRTKGGSFPSASYYFWKKVPPNNRLIGEPINYVPIAYIANASWINDLGSETLKIVVGKNHLKFQPKGSPMTAEMMLLNILIKNNYY